MRVLMTGGTGKVGKAAIGLLNRMQHEVTTIGRRPNQDSPGAQYVQCDVGDFESLRDVCRGHDAIVHLAARGTPVGAPGHEVFRVNDLGTFNVFEAAAEAGIRRVVSASSINALGYYFGDRGVPISFLPIDEEHPTLATDAYSFSKQIMESIGEYFWQRDRISSVMLRLPVVIRHERILADENHYAVYDSRTISRILRMDTEQRTAELARLQTGYDAYRRAHRCDKQVPEGWWGEPDTECELTVDEFLFMHHKVNFFTYIDELDSAQSIAKALTAGYNGSHALFVNAKRNSLGLPVSEVARLFAPDSPMIRPSKSDDAGDTIVSIDRARELIGFEPEWSVSGSLGPRER